MEKHDYLCGALVERAYAEAGARHAKAREADRAARRELHRVAGAFFSREEAKRAAKLLGAWPEGGDAALARILSCTLPRANACRLRPWTRFTRNCSSWWENHGACWTSPAV